MHIFSSMPARAGSASAIKGFVLAYHDKQHNHCPGCGRTQWIVGRMTAQCAFCETALPLDHISGHGYAPRFITRGEEYTGMLPPLSASGGGHASRAIPPA